MLVLASSAYRAYSYLTSNAPKKDRGTPIVAFGICAEMAYLLCCVDSLIMAD